MGPELSNVGFCLLPLEHVHWFVCVEAEVKTAFLTLPSLLQALCVDGLQHPHP